MHKRLLLVAVLLSSIAVRLTGQEARREIELSPHAAALMLVFEAKRAEIRKVDKENWWHDVKERDWVVRRPFHPGTIDSTHTFVVTYRIGGQTVQSWLVDTRKKTVQADAPQTGKEKD